MANIKSQIKRNRQNEKRRVRNRVYRGEARTAIKQVRMTMAAGNLEESRAAMVSAIRTLDRASEKGVLHRNNVARRKSRLMKQLHKLEAAPAKVQPAAQTKKADSKTRKESSQSQVAKGGSKIEAKPKAASKEEKNKKETGKKPTKN